MVKYRKKPVVIEAIQFTNKGNHQEIADFVGKKLKIQDMGDTIIIPTLEGDMKASVNDFIIKGVSGEFYPCKPDIFKQTYEKVEE